MNNEINIPNNILTALRDLTNDALNYYKTPKTIELKHKLLLDYIINLHNKYENQVHRYMILKEHTANLQEENEKLTKFKYNISNDKTTSVPTIIKSYKNEYEDYKSRCEKAISMLKELNIKLKDILKIGIDIKEIDDIENILRGE